MGLWTWITEGLQGLNRGLTEEPRNDWRYANFGRDEVACKCCGGLVEEPRALEALDRLRDKLPGIRINCGYRCPVHNARVGGAPLSQHKLGSAFDLSTRGQYYRQTAVAAAKSAGFTGFGLYNTFVHVDMAKRTFKG